VKASLPNAPVRRALLPDSDAGKPIEFPGFLYTKKEDAEPVALAAEPDRPVTQPYGKLQTSWAMGLLKSIIRLVSVLDFSRLVEGIRLHNPDIDQRDASAVLAFKALDDQLRHLRGGQ
jgi:hypothetical protein